MDALHLVITQMLPSVLLLLIGSNLFPFPVITIQMSIDLSVTSVNPSSKLLNLRVVLAIPIFVTGVRSEVSLVGTMPCNFIFDLNSL